MIGSARILRRATLVPAIAGALLAMAPAAWSEGGAAGPVPPLARVLEGERAGLSASGARVAALGAALRPVARDGAAVTVATRTMPADARAAAVLDVAALDRLPAARGDAEWQCLATAIYFEARGEPLAGQVAVAEVVLNRVDDRRYPRSICGVTNQGAAMGRNCQFSYACDGRSDVMRSPASKARAEKLAKLMIDGRPRTVTSGATHFHATYVRPGWASRLTRTASIGQHVFYRYPTRTASR